MRVLIPTINEDVSLNAQPAKIFSNARAFLIYETNTKEFYSVKNTFYGAKEPHIARDLKNLGIDNIIVEDICKGCYKNLKREGIEIWEDIDSIYLREALQKFELGGLFLKSTLEIVPPCEEKLSVYKSDSISVLSSGDVIFLSTKSISRLRGFNISSCDGILKPCPEAACSTFDER